MHTMCLCVGSFGLNWQRTPPSPTGLASDISSVCQSFLKYPIHFVEMASLIDWKAVSSTLVHCHGTPFLQSRHSGSAIELTSFMNLALHNTEQRKLRKSLTSVGVSHSLRALTRSSVGDTPSLENLRP